MFAGAFSYRVPATGWLPPGWTPPAQASTASMVATRHVHLRTAHRTPQFWLLWLVLCMNVSAGIGIIGAASPMLQETVGGALIDQPARGFAELRADPAGLAGAVAVGAGVVFRPDRAQSCLRGFFPARNCDVSVGRARRGVTLTGAVRRLLLPHRLHVRRWLCHHSCLPGRSVRHPVRGGHSRPPAYRMVNRRHSWAHAGELSARRATGIRRALCSRLQPHFSRAGRHAGDRSAG